MTNSTLIKDYASAQFKGFYERVLSLTKLNHKLTKGELRELFTSELLSNYLTSQFDTGTGIVVDADGNQSHQMDIIITDNRILPPIIKNSGLGVFPYESVLAVIEVKSSLTKKSIEDTEKKFKHSDSFMNNNKKLKGEIIILKGIIGFTGNRISELKNGHDKSWLSKNINHIQAICHVQKYSWIIWKKSNTWKYCEKDDTTFEETKRFIAWLLDNVRNQSNNRLNLVSQGYIPWLSSYIRNEKNVI